MNNGLLNEQSELQQIRACTRLAISHLLDKLNKKTGTKNNAIFELLKKMCSHFMNERNVFELLQDNTNNNECGLGEIGCCFDQSAVPEHYTILSRSISGQNSGNLSKHSSKKSYLFYRRCIAEENERAITAIALIDASNGEEAPLGFELIAQTPGSKDANLTKANKNNKSLYLCVYRGNGPKITNLGVVHVKKENIPSNWHFIARTMNGKAADLDFGHTVLAYKRSYAPIIKQFESYSNNGNGSINDLIAQCIACLVVGIYSFDRQTFVHSLEAFTILESIKTFPTGLFAHFLSCVRDSITAYISLFARDIYSKVLKWANHIFEAFGSHICLRSFIQFLHLCMFCRYEDVREETSMNLIKQMLKMKKHKLKLPQTKHENNVFGSMQSIIYGLVNHIETVKMTQNDFTKFLNFHVVDEEFTQFVIVWIESLQFDNSYFDFLSAAIIILSKISSQKLPISLTAKSETIKRRIHGMKLLSFLLSDGDSTLILCQNDILLVLLRRVVFSSFIFNVITPIPALFKKMLSLFNILWREYRTHLKWEIGVLLDIGICGLLQSKYCTLPQKIDLLRGLLEIFQNRGALINIFYNFDNDIDHWPICLKLVSVLSKLTQTTHIDEAQTDNSKSLILHSLMLLSRFMQLIAKYLKAPNLSSGGNIDEQETFDSLGGGLEAMLDHIHLQRRQQSNANATLLSLYSGVSGQSELDKSKNSDLQSLSSLGSRSLTSAKQQKSEKTESPSKQNQKQEDDEEEEEEKKEFVQPSIYFLDDSPIKSRRDDRRSSVHVRTLRHNEENEIIEKALKKAQSEKVKTAIKFLVSYRGHPRYSKLSSLPFIAHFLYNNDSLDKVQIGDFLSSLETKQLFSESEHNELLMLYVSQLNFCGQSFDSAFRHFLTDSGWRLPKEAQKIERLLIAFSKIFISHNPNSKLVNEDNALFLAYGMLLLNTELHDPRIRESSHHSPMTKQQFYKVVQSGSGKKGKRERMSKKMLGNIYESVKNNAIEIQIEETYEPHSKQIAFRKECNSLINKSLAKMRTHCLKKQIWQKAKNREVVGALYQVLWHEFLVSISTILTIENRDAQTLRICLDAIKYCCASAICLHLVEPHLHSFLCNLAKFVYCEQNKHLLPSAIHLQVVRGEHISQQQWLSNITNYAKTGNLKSGCQVVSHICNDMKAMLHYDANQSFLRRIELELGNSLYLVHPNRTFIHSGALTKKSSKNELACYRFYLFNDLLIYCSKNANKQSGNAHSFAVHRVLQLSLCQIVDDKKNSFRILSPQKSIFLIATTNKEKHEWFQMIEAAIKKEGEARARWINENYQSLQEYHESAQISKYLGRNRKMKKHELHRIQNGKSIKNEKNLNPIVADQIKVFFERSAPCKLCSRPFKRFTRKSKCPWCLEIVCKDCFRKKVALPEKSQKNEMIKVCDACFGAISTHLNDDFLEIDTTTMTTTNVRL